MTDPTKRAREIARKHHRGRGPIKQMDMIEDILETLEAATEGSRELDAKVHALALGDDWTARTKYDDGSGEWFCYSKSLFNDKAGTVPKAITPPAYTSKPYDLTAAATLVPEGNYWHVANQGQVGAKHLAFAGVYGPPMVGSECDTHAPEPALALTIAAVRASHHISETPNE